ncbi:MAG: hypothetical protein KC457_31235, partial [Myxococcales bacterium]|nr:hypothetical protein [Myxococcales bacterium]
RGAHSRLAGEVGDDDGTRTLHGRILAGALPKGLVSAATRRRLHRRSPLARASLGKRGEASPSGALTGAFLSRSRQLLRFAKPTIPTGTVFADSASLSSIANLAKQGTNAKTSNQTVAQAKSISLVQPVGAKVLAGKLGALGTRAKGAPAPAPTPAELELRALANAARAGLDPDAILGARLQTLVRAPTGWARAQWQQATKASPVPARLQACPSFDAPLIDALIARDPELLMPGVGRLPADSIGLAQINGAFVEAFLLGANHELAREFVWREYPADLGDTWLRRFWDTLDEGGQPSFDIAPVDRWKPRALGTHQQGVDPARTLVLVIKGQLLRRYPDTLIYAVPAAWQGAVRIEGPQDRLHPAFVGALGRDVAFLGFCFPAGVDVRRDVIGSPRAGAGRPGWFFAFEQPATGPRFGLDLGRSQQAGRIPATWSELSWVHVMGTGPAQSHLPLSPLAARNPTRPYDDEGANTWTERWALDAAAMARITFQRPVRMLVHADQLLSAPSEQES